MDTKAIVKNVCSSLESIKRVVETVASLDDGHGYRPERNVETNARYAEAVEAEVITRIRGAWGHRLTDLGRKVLVEIAAERRRYHDSLRAAGFDPDMKVNDMTDEELDRYMAWRRGVKP